MDEMKIRSAFTTNILSKLIRMIVRKKIGCDIRFKLNEATAAIVDGKTHIHLDVDADLEKEEMMKLLRDIGL